MRIERKICHTNIRKRFKRTMYTSVSMLLCTILICTSMFLFSSFNGIINDISENEYKDYHFVVRDVNYNEIVKIKNKQYIDEIYCQEKDGNLIKLSENRELNKKEKFNIYIKYRESSNSLKYSKDIINELGNYSLKDLVEKDEEEIKSINNKYEFNKHTLIINGIINPKIEITNSGTNCVADINYQPLINLLIILTIVIFSILSIIILYNAFLITTDERKKEYAILNSVGATEGQIIKIVQYEVFLIGLISIVLGLGISYLLAGNIIKNLNLILMDTGFSLKLLIDYRYIIFSIILILINIFIAALIPCLNASTTSVIQGIKNANGIKRKKINIFEKISSIEGKIAIKSIKRNKKKYRVIKIFLVVCMVSFIVIDTYINYQKVAVNLVNKYDVDARANIESDYNFDYKKVFNLYKNKYDKSLKYSSYKEYGLYCLVNSDDLVTNNEQFVDIDSSDSIYKNKKLIKFVFIELDEDYYKEYIKKINAKYGDRIIYNNITNMTIKDDMSMKYDIANLFKYKKNLKIDVVGINSKKSELKYNKIDVESLKENVIITDELCEGFKDYQTKYLETPIIFVNSSTMENIKTKLYEFENDRNNIEYVSKWIWGDEDTTIVNIKTDKLVLFSNYITSFMEYNKLEENFVGYYSLEGFEKNIYINFIKYILKVIMIGWIIIGLVSTINVLNASFNERKREFYMLNSIGATKQNIRKILVRESIYIYIKSLILSILISIPGIIFIRRGVSELITLNKVLIPYLDIIAFIAFLFVLLILVTLIETSKFMDKEIIE